MKSFTVYQPYAFAIVAGLKANETRPRRTNIRGRVAIHAAKKDPHSIMINLPHNTAEGIYKALYSQLGIQSGALEKMQTGAVIGTVEIVDCVPVEKIAATLTERERLLGDYSPGRWAWILENPVIFPAPIPARGQQGWWNWEEPNTDMCGTCRYDTGDFVCHPHCGGCNGKSKYEAKRNV